MDDISWVKLYRKSIENGWLQNYKLWAFWCYCLLRASHKEHTQFVGFKQVKLQPGEFVFGRRKVSKDLRMSEQSIRTCVQILKSSGNIDVKSTNRFSIVNICNWNTYQGNDISNQPTTNPRLTNNQPTTNHKQECNNVKNVRKENLIVEFPTEIDDLYKFFISTLPDRYIPKNDALKNKWMDALDKCNRIDKYKYWQIKDIIEYFRADEFWTVNFNSPLKLRQQNKDGIKYIDIFYEKIKDKIVEPPDVKEKR